MPPPVARRETSVIIIEDIESDSEYDPQEDYLIADMTASIVRKTKPKLKIK